MDVSKIDEMLTRLSLDGKRIVEASGFRGYPVLAVGGATLLARQKTVLARRDGERYVPRPGVEFVIVDVEGCPVSEFAGRPCHPGVSHLTCEEFARRYGQLFAVSEIEVEEPEDPFAPFFEP